MLHQEIKATASLKLDEKLIFLVEIKKTKRMERVNKGGGKKKPSTRRSQPFPLHRGRSSPLTQHRCKKQIPSKAAEERRAESILSVKRQLCIFPCAH